MTSRRACATEHRGDPRKDFLSFIESEIKKSLPSRLASYMRKHLLLNEFAKITQRVTCGMIVSRDRKSWSPILEMSIPSIQMLPPALSRIRNKAKAREDLPAPVRPTIPTWRAFDANDS